MRRPLQLQQGVESTWAAEVALSMKAPQGSRVCTLLLHLQRMKATARDDRGSRN
jgi:hypothetical protein